MGTEKVGKNKQFMIQPSNYLEGGEKI